jgi:transcriptional regulator GlxA family with amidase domain
VAMRENRTIPLRRGPLAEARNIAILAFDGVSPFHFAVPLLVFGEDRQELGVPRFQLRVCAAEAGPLRSGVGLTLAPSSGLRGLNSADIVIVPSWRNVHERPPQEVLVALQRAHRRGATIVGLCLGAFVLAEAGLLDGKTATTHWHWAAAFRERFPQVRLEPDVLYVDEDRILTSAGTAAGIDCCLYLLQCICGSQVANRVARRLVIAPHRAGGQAQFIEEPVPQSAAGDRLGSVLAWAASRLQEQHSIDSLAQRAVMSRRSFTRHFQKATGASVLQWLLQQRLAAACRLLEGGTQSVEAIATAVGFGSAVSLRQHFLRAYGLSPQAYRRQFRPAARTSDVAPARVRMQ